MSAYRVGRPQLREQLGAQLGSALLAEILADLVGHLLLGLRNTRLVLFVERVDLLVGHFADLGADLAIQQLFDRDSPRFGFELDELALDQLIEATLHELEARGHEVVPRSAPRHRPW